MKNTNVTISHKCEKYKKPKHVLKSISSVKIVVTRVYADEKPMEKAFSDYLSQQIATTDKSPNGCSAYGSKGIMMPSDSLLP